MLAWKWLFLHLHVHLVNARDRGNAKRFRGALSLLGCKRRLPWPRKCAAFSRVFSSPEGLRSNLEVCLIQKSRCSRIGFFVAQQPLQQNAQRTIRKSCAQFTTKCQFCTNYTKNIWETKGLTVKVYNGIMYSRWNIDNRTTKTRNIVAQMEVC